MHERGLEAEAACLLAYVDKGLEKMTAPTPSGSRPL
jgi:hypothetical protein